MAFPFSDGFNEPQYGLTLRDYFAAQALQALVVKFAGEDGELDTLPKSAYQFADAMLLEREGGAQ